MFGLTLVVTCALPPQTPTPPQAPPVQVETTQKAPAKAAQPGGHALRVLVNGWGGSATPLACENGKTLVVTNAHVFPRRFRHLPAKVVLPDGRELPARWLEGSESLGDGSSVRTEEPDLAALVVDGELTPVPLAAEAPAPGEAVTHWGVGPTEIGRAPVGRVGRVADVYGWSHNFLMTTCPSQSGDSGSGVLNAKGELVGVTRGRDASERYHRAQPLHTVRAFLARRAIVAAFPRLGAAVAGAAPACPCPLTDGDCAAGKCPPGCDCGKADPAADTRMWRVNGQGSYTTAQIRAMGLALPGEAAACPTGTCPQQRPAAAPTYYYYTLPGSCPNGTCPNAR